MSTSAASLRHAFVRRLLRTTGPLVARTDTPIALQRALLDSAGFTMRAPRGVTAKTTTLGRRPARRVVPRDVVAGRTVLYLHGGAYVSGGLRSHGGLVAQIAARARATAWLVDYRLAPEHPYPAAVDDAFEAYRALLDAGSDATAIVIAGDSAGGGLTLATALALRDAGLPLPAALVLISPWTDLTLSGASVTTKAGADPMLNGHWLDWAAGLYAGATLRTNPGLSPLFADFSGLPPMLVQVGSDEILLDDALQLAPRAQAAGVALSLRVFEGLWHVFQAQAGLIPEADDALRDIGAFIEQHCR